MIVATKYKGCRSLGILNKEKKKKP